MKVEFLIINNDDVIAIVYNYEPLGRVVIVTGEFDFNFPLRILNSDGIDVESIDMMNFLLKALLPHEEI